MKENTLKDYDLLKVIATILVVFAHITRMYTGDGVVIPINGSVMLRYITIYIYSFHMPLFVAISGSIYYYVRQKSGRYDDRKKFLLNKAKRLMIPYIVFGTLYVAPIMEGFYFTNDNFINYVVKGIILSTNSRHLWYVFMLFNIFVIFYSAEKYINRIPKWLSIMILIGLYIVSSKLPVILQINNTCKYLIYFYLGYLFDKNRAKIKNILKFNSSTLISSIIINLLTLYLSLILNIQLNFSKVIKVFTVSTLSLCSAIFGMITIYSITNLLLATNIFNNKLYQEIKENSFGIYLFHPMIIYVLFYYLGNKNITPFLLSGIIFIISMTLSDLCTRIIRTINLEIIIGEKQKAKCLVRS